MTDILDHTYAVIMAGGGGTRLWPLSRRNRPKQMLPLLEEHRTLFQTTVQRLKGLLPNDRIFVVTVAEQVDTLRAQSPEIPSENFIVEPMPRGTASVVGLAAVILQERDPEAVMIVLPADHYIRNRDLFHILLRVAVDVAERDYLVTLGVTPTYAATGYGYIQRGEPIPERVVYPTYRVLKFTEKPTEEQARQMIASGDHSWNSGMFIWRARVILEEIAKHLPSLSTVLNQIADSGSDRRTEVINQLWPHLENVTIDYGIMERAERVAVLPAGGLEWSDVGSWDSLFDIRLPDKDGNIIFGANHLAEDTHHTLIYDNTNSNRLIVTIGVDDLIVVDTPDVLLVCHKDHTQKVRWVVETLRQSKQEQYI